MSIGRTVTVKRVPDGFAVVRDGKQVRQVADVFTANQEAIALHRENMMMRQLGELMGQVDEPLPVLQLWLEGGANATP